MLVAFVCIVDSSFYLVTYTCVVIYAFYFCFYFGLDLIGILYLCCDQCLLLLFVLWTSFYLVTYTCVVIYYCCFCLYCGLFILFGDLYLRCDL